MIAWRWSDAILMSLSVGHRMTCRNGIYNGVRIRVGHHNWEAPTYAFTASLDTQMQRSARPAASVTRVWSARRWHNAGPKLLDKFCPVSQGVVSRSPWVGETPWSSLESRKGSRDKSLRPRKGGHATIEMKGGLATRFCLVIRIAPLLVVRHDQPKRRGFRGVMDMTVGVVNSRGSFVMNASGNWLQECLHIIGT